MADVGTIFGADDSGGNRGIQTERAAEGQNPVANLHSIGISELGDGQVVAGLDLDHGEVGVFVEAHDAASVFRGVAVERDLNFGGLIDDVIVGEDEAFFVDNDAGAETAFGVGTFVRLLQKAIEEIFEGIALAALGFLAAFGLLHDLGGGNVYDRRTDFFGDGGEGIGKHDGIGQREQLRAGSALVVGGLGVAGDHGADQDADAKSESDEQSGENLAATHPDV